MRIIDFIQEQERIVSGRLSTEDTIKVINRLVDDLRSSKKWREFIKFQSSFHKYSFSNALLIMLARPDATMVRGFKQWKALGRYVRKGEKGIPILAPMLRKVPSVTIVKEIDPVTGEETEVEKREYVQKLVGFLTVFVFDVKQTEGKPLPCIEEFIRTIESSTMSDRFDILRKVVEKNGIPVRFEKLKKHRGGYYDVTDNRIVINEESKIDMAFKTLIHEYAHALLRLKDLMPKRKKDEIEVKISTSEEEVIVEATAFIVADKFGLDTSEYSAGYIALYQESAPIDVLRQDLSVIQALSEMIIRDIESVATTGV